MIIFTPIILSCLSPTSHLPLSWPFFLLNGPLNFTGSVYRSVNAELFTGAQVPYWWLYYCGKCLFFLRESIAAYKSSGRSGVSWTPPHSLAGCWQAQLCAGCYEIKNAAIMHIWKAMFCTFPCFPLSYILSHPIFYKLYLSLGMDDIDTPLMVEHSTVNYFHLFEQSWTSNVTISHCKKKLLRPKLTSVKSI